ncbi:hypothetical protein [Streptomyces sp. NPDC017520]|uniref:hypothetical protein n=1 Tax=Streptomyces sp. NPDC017520 TaxID=3364998 RepID=UPI0037981A50
MDLLLTDYEWHCGDSTPWRHHLQALHEEVAQADMAAVQQSAADSPAKAAAPPADSSRLTGIRPSGGAPADPAREASLPQPTRAAENRPSPSPASADRIGRRASAALAALAFGAAAPTVPSTAPSPQAQRPAIPELPRHMVEQARHAARRLRALRADGRSGEAHALLAAAAAASPEDVVALIDALQESGQDMEIPDLLWELASLCPGEQARTSAALKTHGRTAHAGHSLRLAAGLPAAAVAELAGELFRSGHVDLGTELLKAVLITRPRADAVAIVQAKPSLTGQLIATAQNVSADCHRSLLFMLRTDGDLAGR